MTLTLKHHLRDLLVSASLWLRRQNNLSFSPGLASSSQPTLFLRACWHAGARKKPLLSLLTRNPRETREEQRRGSFPSVTSPVCVQARWRIPGNPTSCREKSCACWHAGAHGLPSLSHTFSLERDMGDTLHLRKPHLLQLSGEQRGPLREATVTGAFFFASSLHSTSTSFKADLRVRPLREATVTGAFYHTRGAT